MSMTSLTGGIGVTEGLGVTVGIGVILTESLGALEVVCSVAKGAAESVGETN